MKGREAGHTSELFPRSSGIYTYFIVWFLLAQGVDKSASQQWTFEKKMVTTCGVKLQRLVLIMSGKIKEH